MPILLANDSPMAGIATAPRMNSPMLEKRMRLIDEQFLETPWYGSRQMARHLRRNGCRHR
jgi:putative transposase